MDATTHADEITRRDPLRGAARPDLNGAPHAGSVDPAQGAQAGGGEADGGSAPLLDEVLAALTAAIDGLASEDRAQWPGPARVDRALELTRWKDRLDAEVLRAIGDADRDGAWRAGGALTCPSWLASQASVAKPDATRMVRSARLARDHARTGKALAAGDITVAHVDQLARAARNREELFVEHEHALVDVASSLDPQQLGLVARRWALLADDQLATGDPFARFQRRYLHVSSTFAGLVAIDGLLDPEGGARVIAALRAVDRPDPVDADLPPRSFGQRMADALVTICDGQPQPAAPTDDHAPARRPSPRPSITVTIDADTLTGTFPADLTRARCDIEGVGPVAPATIRRLSCDAALTRMVMSPSQVLDVGKPTKVIPDHLRRAVIIRDEGCVATSCDAPAAWCDVHHVVARSDGGPTAEHNLVLLCRRHHVATHEGGWLIARHPGGWAARPPRPTQRPTHPVGHTRAPP